MCGGILVCVGVVLQRDVLYMCQLCSQSSLCQSVRPAAEQLIITSTNEKKNTESESFVDSVVFCVMSSKECCLKIAPKRSLPDVRNESLENFSWAMGKVRAADASSAQSGCFK